MGRGRQFFLPPLSYAEGGQKLRNFMSNILANLGNLEHFSFFPFIAEFSGHLKKSGGVE